MTFEVKSYYFSTVYAHTVSNNRPPTTCESTVDLAAEELRLAASELGRITGAVDVEEVLDVLFADFCIGK